MVNRDDLKIDTYEAGSLAFSAVRVTHIPTGKIEIVDEFNNTILNREEAIKRLEARLTRFQPYEGDPGDESDHDRFADEGGR